MDKRVWSGRQWAVVAASVVLVALVVVRNVVDLATFDRESAYEWFELSEWMVNYEGGFVRRGLTGQLLWWLTGWLRWEPYVWFRWMDLTLMAVCVGIVVRTCWKEHWMPLLPLAMVSVPAVLYRRDFLMLLVAFATFALVVRWIGRGGWWRASAASLLSAVAVLAYEPSFFFIVPVSAMLTVLGLRGKHGLWGAVCRTVAVWTPATMAMVAVCVAKGDMATAERIWASWLPLIDWSEGRGIGHGVAFLGMDTVEAVGLHLRLNYGIGDEGAALGWHPGMVVAEVLMVGCCYFLTCRMGGDSMVERRTCVMLSDVFCIQTVCLLPMLTVLSCDFGRTMLCLVYSTLMLVHLLRREGLDVVFPFTDAWSARAVGWMQQVGVMKTLWFYVAVLLLMPLHSFCGASLSMPIVRELLSILIIKN